MDIKINTEIESFHKDLINTINSHNSLPVSVIYFVLKDCFNEVTAAYNTILQKEEKGENMEQEQEA